ncbi:hypothetical protein CPB83DRAFT_850103 [Crepidotus variabilis]|uniref:Uncharacterized protein n=1 Tax=Crepidotus variabilis TaxID=179855 RepID=A0A9P6EKU3_9AGAR|nr:hypothetical protein CPB83DRAFT_850103 [Crepidotus variabilis]
MPPSKAAPARKPAAERAPKKANEKSNDECSHQKVPVRRRRRNSNPKKEIIGPQKTSSKVARKPTKATVGPSTPKLQQVRNTSTTSFTIKVKPLFSVQKQNAAIWHSKSSKTDLALFSPTDADDEVEERQKQQRFEQTAGCQSSKAKRRDSDLLPTVDVAADYISSDSPRYFSNHCDCRH